MTGSTRVADNKKRRSVILASLRVCVTHFEDEEVLAQERVLLRSALL